MRKNGVNRELTEITGGVCAPSGFTACAVEYENLKSNQTESIGFIFGKRRFPSAYLGAQGANASACVKISQKHLEKNEASTMIIHNGNAITHGAKADTVVETICRLSAKYFNIDRNDVILSSLGCLGGKTQVENFEEGFKACSKSNLPLEKNSYAVARVLDKENPQQLAFSFELGDWVCKIGAVFTNNGNGKFCFLTTDVKISPKMIRKALNHVANECFYMTPTRNGETPHDCIAIIASEEAENWRITETNGDYEKFTYALRMVTDKICRRMVTQLEEKENLCLCKVVEAKSKRTAREIAMKVISSLQQSKGLELQAVLRAILAVDELVDMEKLTVSVAVEDKTFVLFEDGSILPFNESKIYQETYGKNAEIFINLRLGNYSATAFGSIKNR